MAVNLFQYYNQVLDNIFQDYWTSRFNFNVCIDTYLQPAVEALIQNYSVDGLKTPDSLDFNDIKLRCAYLYMYATSHSHMVLDAMRRLDVEDASQLANLIVTARAEGSFNITSLGGGPGSDPLGILVFLDRDGYWTSCPDLNVHLVDEYGGWEGTFRSVVARYRMRADFTAQNLMMPLSPTVRSVIRGSHLITMVKFISAISANRTVTNSTLRTIFQLLRPGTLVLIIDNAGGGDFQRALDMAYDQDMVPVFPPVCHYDFKIPQNMEMGMGRMRFGSKRAQTGSKISMVVLRKETSLLNRIRTFQGDQTDFFFPFNSGLIATPVSSYLPDPEPPLRPILKQTNRVQPISRLPPMVQHQPLVNQWQASPAAVLKLYQQQAAPSLGQRQLAADTFPKVYPQSAAPSMRQTPYPQSAAPSSRSTAPKVYPQSAAPSTSQRSVCREERTPPSPSNSYRNYVLPPALASQNRPQMAAPSARPTSREGRRRDPACCFL